MSSPKKQSRARIWCFTINNYTEKDENHLLSYFKKYAKKYVFQEEEEKTKHYQGVVQFNSQKTFTHVKKFMKRHIGKYVKISVHQ